MDDTDEELAQVLRPNGEPSELWPEDLATLFSYEGELCGVTEILCS
jgi:hypothetical protein